MRGLPRMVAQTPIGKEVEVEFLRKGQKKTTKVALGRLAEDEDPPKATAGKPVPKGKGGKRGDLNNDKDKGGAAPGATVPVIGLALAPLTEELRTKHGIRATTKGLIVLEVDPASPAAEKGVKVGDVIVEAAQEAVATIDDINRNVDKVRKSGRKAVLLRLENGTGETRFVAMPIQ
jgi:serine protease Do